MNIVYQTRRYADGYYAVPVWPPMIGGVSGPHKTEAEAQTAAGRLTPWPQARVVEERDGYIKVEITP